MQFVLKVFHKISDPVRRRAFLDEVEHLKSLNHPAITRIFDEGTYLTYVGAEYPFAVIEYVPLTSRELLVSKQIDVLRAIRIAFNCLSALDCLHRAVPPLIHRDIKPENILISDIGAKLADFGLVKVLDEGSYCVLGGQLASIILNSCVTDTCGGSSSAPATSYKCLL